MKIIITGGAGFIGSWVVDCYLKNNHKVLVMDNLYGGSKENISADAEFVECDIRDASTVEKVFKEFQPEIVNHHAAQKNVRLSVDNPYLDADVNIMGLLNILESSRKSDVKKIIFASTGGAIYGEPEILPADETTDEKPLSPYGVSKLCAESYLAYYKELYGLSYTALRYSNVYGGRQNPQGGAGIVAIFCNNMLNGINCKIFGDGKQTRDYVYCEDVARANLLSLTYPDTDGIYNIGTSVETSINEIFENLKQISGSISKAEYLPGNLGEVKKISLNSSSAARKLNWKPQISFNKGLKKTWEWFNKNK